MKLFVAIIGVLFVHCEYFTCQALMLKSYLKEAAHFVRRLRSAENPHPGKITLLLGNEAADADSIVSALCYSYLKFCSSESRSFDTATSVFLPLVGVGRKALRLRRDVEVLLSKVDIALEDLICIDDYPFSHWPNADMSSFVLLDHNHLTQSVTDRIPGQPQVHVDEIIDHHVDLKMHKECTGPSRNIAFDGESSMPLVGSACTLVHEKFNEVGQSMSGDVATILMGVIAIDTLNMDPTFMKGTPRDERALQQLQTLSSEDRVGLFDLVRNAKTDPAYWSALSAEDALQLDYKTFQSASGIPFGMSSVLLDNADIFLKTDLATSVLGYLRGGETVHDGLSQGLGALVVMGFVLQPAPHRELIIFAPSRERLEIIDTLLTAEEAVGLQPQVLGGALEPLLGLGIHVQAYSQANIKLSRKQLAPLFQKIL